MDIYSSILFGLGALSMITAVVIVVILMTDKRRN